MNHHKFYIAGHYEGEKKRHNIFIHSFATIFPTIQFNPKSDETKINIGLWFQLPGSVPAISAHSNISHTPNKMQD